MHKSLGLIPREWKRGEGRRKGKRKRERGVCLIWEGKAKERRREKGQGVGWKKGGCERKNEPDRISNAMAPS